MKKKSMLNKFLHYYKPYIFDLVLDLLAAVIMSGVTVVYPILTRKVFNTYVPAGDVKMIIIIGIVLFCTYLLRYGCRYFMTAYGHTIGIRMQSDMRRDLFEKYQDLPFSFYDEHESGELLSRLANDLNDVSELAHHGPENILVCAITFTAGLIYLFSVSWILTLVLIGMVPIMFCIAFFTRKKQMKAFLSTKKDLASINATVQSSISGIRVTKSFCNKENELELFDSSNKKYVKSRTYVYRFMGLYFSSTTFIVDVFNVAVIIGGGLLVLLTDAFDVGDYLAFAVSVSLFTSPVMTLINFTEQFNDGRAGFKRFNEIMEQEPEVDNPEAIQEIALKGNIKFDHVSFKYDTSDGVLDDICFEIKEGETVALVGTSGGGKTTICHLIPKFYRITQGDISIDGHSIYDISNKALRNNIGLVQQDVFLFNGTIKSNILYGKLDATDEEVIEAAKRANIYDFIMSLPNKFDSTVGERGVKLSGGQKQRISIARIFLKNPSILILDEATSALDNSTELMIQKSLNELAKGRTSIVVAHRLSTIKNANRIFVIDGGKIVETGTHKDLMAKDGAYAKLYNEQFALM